MARFPKLNRQWSTLNAVSLLGRTSVGTVEPLTLLKEMPLIRTGLSAESKTLNIVPPFPLIMVRLVPAPTRVIEFVRLKVEFQPVLPAGKTTVSPSADLAMAADTAAYETSTAMFVAASVGKALRQRAIRTELNIEMLLIRTILRSS